MNANVAHLCGICFHLENQRTTNQTSHKNTQTVLKVPQNLPV